MIACEKKKHISYHIENVTIREALEIKDGSYFIYIDSISGAIDSGYVNGQHSIQIYNDLGDYSFESLGYLLNLSSFKLSFSSYYAVWPGGTSLINFALTGDTVGYSQMVALSTPFNINDHENKSYLSWKSVWHYDTLQIRNKLYHDVYEYLVVYTNGFSFNSFYSPSEGLVKFRMKESSVEKIWELEKSEILR